MHPLTDHLDRRSEPVGYDDWPKADVVPGAGRVVSDPTPASDLLLRNLRPLPRLLLLAIRRNHRRLIKEKKKKNLEERKKRTE